MPIFPFQFPQIVGIRFLDLDADAGTGMLANNREALNMLEANGFILVSKSPPPHPRAASLRLLMSERQVSTA